MRITCSTGITKIDIQPEIFTIFLPDSTQENIDHLNFFQSLFPSVQQPWMKPFRPGFSLEKKMKLVLHRPENTPATPAALLAAYTDMLRQLRDAAQEQPQSEAIS